MSLPKDHLAMQQAELKKLDDQLAMMRHWGVAELDPGFQRLWRARGIAMGKLGFRLPRTTTLVLKLLALSPGEVNLFADADLGWMTEARVKPGAPPVIKYVSDEVARALVRGELTHELEEELMTPDEYTGE